MVKDGGKGSGIEGHKTSQQKKIEEADKWVDEYYSDQATIKKLEAEIRHQYQVIANERDNTKTQKKAVEAETKRKNLEDQVKKLKSKWKWMKDMAITKDTMEILRLSGFTVDEEVSPKFKKVMEEFGRGELKSSSGEKVTDPKQAKAIAYSEAGETKDISVHQYAEKLRKEAGHSISHEQMAKELKKAGWSKEEAESEVLREAVNRVYGSKDSDCGKVFTKGTEDGYKMEDPKEIEAATKRVKESGHPDPHYLAGLQRALEIAKQERGMKDDDATKEGSIKKYGQENNSKMEDEEWITMKGAHVKIDEGESKEKASKEFIKKKGGDPEPAKGKKQSGEVKYDEKEIENIKNKWAGKESKPGYGSEYGDILNHLEKQANLPDMEEYYKLSDQLWNMRAEGKKGTPEYKEVEKKKNDFNKNYNKLHKALEEKARSLSSESEQKRLEEVKQFAKKNKISQDSAIQVECNEILRLSGFIS